MNPALSRRSLLKAASAAAFAAPLLWGEHAEAAVKEASQTVFGFGVASGDPTADAIMLWTRVTPTPAALPGSGVGGPVTVTWELAGDAAFHNIVKHGTTVATATRDHTVHVDVTGLPAYTRFFYRFRALGATSQVGETRTAPDVAGELHALRFAFTSCANYTGGYFSAYRHMAARDDLDFVLFLGDYIYEYGNGSDRYGPDELAGKRDHEPATDPITVLQYRQRHALYKTDPDLQAVHRRHPWIYVFDDHEVADNSYNGGAVNHDPATQGDFFARRRMAYQVWQEWMPYRLPDQTAAVGTRFWRRFTYGSLADLSVLESRQNRSQQITGQDQTAVSDPERHLIEPQQMAWLVDGVKAKRTWHLLGNQVVLAQVRLPAVPAVAAMLPVQQVPQGGYVFNTDQWDGYLADQNTLLGGLSAASGDAVVFTGDIHSSWANELPLDPGTYVSGVSDSAGTEFVCPSISSDGFYEVAQRQEAGALGLTNAVMAANRHVRFLDGIKHGFGVADVTPERVQVDYVWIDSAVDADDPRLDPLATASITQSRQTVAGSRVISTPAGVLEARRDEPRVLAAPPATAPPRTAPARPATGPGRALPTTGLDAAVPLAGVAAVGAALVALRSRGRTTP